jgi:RNA 2',3'-cyclic 3'-phosphodiesterase
MARLFFALWPDADARARLEPLAAELAAAASGKPVPIAKVHLTLAFLGEVEPARIAVAVEAARRVRFPRFAFALDRVGSFRGARVAWAGCAQVPGPLAALAGDLCGRLAAAGFALEDRPYTPHATLARRIARNVATAAVAPIAWPVAGFSLVRSETGTGRYAVLEAFAPG